MAMISCTISTRCGQKALRRRNTATTRLKVAAVFSLAILALLIPASAQADNACLTCHQVDEEGFAGTVHGFLDCADCHAGALTAGHDVASAAADCSTCHDDLAATYAASVHGRDRANGIQEAPDCLACHGSVHQMTAVGADSSPVNPMNLPGTCGTCHADPEMARRFNIHFVQPLEAYQASIHARSLNAGINAAGCSHCHGSHDIQPAADPLSRVNRNQVPDTCGQCHEQVARLYAESIHGLAASQGVRESPICTDCHGEHRILSPSEPGSPVYVTNIPRMTCERCHNDLRINQKFGLATDKVSAYEDSYHGLAMRSGVAVVANCASCHGIHDILPSTNPRSSVHKDNLRATCGRCHAGMVDGPDLGTIHVSSDEPRFAAVYYIRQIYIWLIILTIGGMLLHNGMDLYRKARNPLPPPPTPMRGTDARMSPGFRAAHMMMLSSFFILVVTGFALKFPEAWWVKPLLQWETDIGLRGLVHRIAGVVMIGALLVHALHLVMSRKARGCISGMLPGRADIHEVHQRFLYFIGRRPTPPAAGKLGYPEKMEYLALIWGSLLMAATGFILWFENLTLGWMPAWATDVATVIHLYEAVLASLSILVWHFYFVIFDPLVYPMDTAWLTGRSPATRVYERNGPPPPLKEAAAHFKKPAFRRRKAR